MSNKEFQSNLKKAIETLGQDTIYEILQNDILYQENIEKESLAKNKYTKLYNSLTSEQQEIINIYSSCCESTNYEYSLISYVAGMRDMFKILLYLKSIKE